MNNMSRKNRYKTGINTFYQKNSFMNYHCDILEKQWYYKRDNFSVNSGYKAELKNSI